MPSFVKNMLVAIMFLGLVVSLAGSVQYATMPVPPSPFVSAPPVPPGLYDESIVRTIYKSFMHTYLSYYGNGTQSHLS